MEMIWIRPLKSGKNFPSSGLPAGRETCTSQMSDIAPITAPNQKGKKPPPGPTGV